ncbi:MAG: ATP-binding protein [Actinomycetales bacterium]
MTLTLPEADIELLELRQRGDARAVALPYHPRAVCVVRHMLAEDLTGQVELGIIDEAEVIASELLGNAIRHARPLEDNRVTLRWQVRGGVLDIEVTDGGSPGEVRARRPAPLATNGRGLRVVRALAHEWGVFQDNTGRRTVWACLGGPSRRRHRW